MNRQATTGPAPPPPAESNFLSVMDGAYQVKRMNIELLARLDVSCGEGMDSRRPRGMPGAVEGKDPPEAQVACIGTIG